MPPSFTPRLPRPLVLTNRNDRDSSASPTTATPRIPNPMRDGGAPSPRHARRRPGEPSALVPVPAVVAAATGWVAPCSADGPWPAGVVAARWAASAGAWAPRALARRPDVLGSRAGPIAGARGTPARGPSSGCGGASTRRRHGSTSTTAALVEPKGNAAAAPVPIGKLSSCLGHYMVSHRFLLYFRGFVQPASLSLLDCSGSTTRKGGEKARKEGDLC